MRRLLTGILPFIATWTVFFGIKVAFGYPAAFWFGLGGLAVAVVAMWEAGNKKKEEGR